MNNLSFTGGASGFRIMEHRPFRQVEHYYTALGMAAIAVAVSLLIVHSKFGMAFAGHQAGRRRRRRPWA